MVKAVTGEETQLGPAEDRLSHSGISAEVGLIIGKLNARSDRGFVYNLIPTPPTDGGEPACSLKYDSAGSGNKKKGSKSVKSSSEMPTSLVIDSDWVAEHARQVSRMLLGGMDVVGMYLWASETVFKATSSTVLSQAVRGIAQASPWYNNACDERLLVHISYSPRRWSCRVCTLASGSFQPCDFKIGKLLASLQAFRCMYNFELRLPVFQDGTSASDTFNNLVCKGINQLAKDLHSAKALINGNLVTEGQVNSSESINEVELLLPFKKDASAEVCSSDEVAGLFVLSGAVYASAYLAPREPISQAISDLKGDIITSLRSRVDIIIEEAEGKVALNSDRDASAEKYFHQVILHELRKPYALAFPRRVLIPWLAGTYICDYLQTSETNEDVKERCKELMSMEFEAPTEASEVVEPERIQNAIMAISFWDVVHGHSASPVDSSNREHLTVKEGTSGKPKRSSTNILAPIVVLLLALLIGWAISVFSWKV